MALLVHFDMSFDITLGELEVTSHGELTIAIGFVDAGCHVFGIDASCMDVAEPCLVLLFQLLSIFATCFHPCIEVLLPFLKGGFDNVVVVGSIEIISLFDFPVHCFMKIAFHLLEVVDLSLLLLDRGEEFTHLTLQCLK